MATTNPTTYLQAKRTEIEALTDGGPVAFHRVWLVPSINMDTLLQIPRYPVALVADGGGQLRGAHGKLWQRIMEVTILTSEDRDHVGEATTEELLRLGELLIAGLEFNRTDNAITLVADSDVTIEEDVESGKSFAFKTYSFTYIIERA